MSITFEEITGEVVAERPERRQPEARETGSQGAELEERFRVLLAQEQRRTQRLCDR